MESAITKLSAARPFERPVRERFSAPEVDGESSSSLRADQTATRAHLILVTSTPPA